MFLKPQTEEMMFLLRRLYDASSHKQNNSVII